MARRIARKLGYDLTQASPYSPIPVLGDLPDTLWSDPAPMPGVDLRLDSGLALLEERLAPLIARYTSSQHGWEPVNPMYGAMDGETLYALLRLLRPRRVLELGAGFSSLVIADAAAANASEGAPFEHVCCDPYPAPPLVARVRHSAEVLEVGSREVPPERFAALEAGDVLFVDTTHAVRPGGDVVHLLLEVLPALPSGVLVHVHDVYRPFEYPRELFAVHRVYWQEHYLVQALLAGGDRFEVLLANHALWRLHPDRVRAVVPSLRGNEAPSALWLRVS